jgi:hypothetical protein
VRRATSLAAAVATVVTTVPALLGGSALLGGPAAVAAPPPSCGPFEAVPSFRGEVPTAEEVLGFPLGARDVTTAESDTYLRAVSAASPRVVDGVLATSVQGRELRYAVVGSAANVAPQRLAGIRQAAARLRDPSTPPAEAAKLAQTTPAILWVAGNVHGGEESGTDASLRVLYELADRDDCAARRVLDNAIVVILPTQNPDGREADTRRNAYGFDMNRDWFARTQPETDGKLAALESYPPVLFIDSHEMGGTSYFFPPNADPIYHEITDESVDWINNLYGASMAAEFTRQGIDFFNRDVYDLFYMGYGDTVPATGYIAAGMTFEKGGADPTSVRTYEQYVAMWTSLGAAVRDKAGLLADWHGAYVEAYQQGLTGKLEPNEIVNPGNELITQVPDESVRHYFLRADDPSKAREVQALVRRLQRMGVLVYTLTAPLQVPDLTPYGRATGPATLPAGTYWVPMAQAQKHWVQAMLHEDTYTPFPYFYDVTAWSQPLLFNVAGGRSGAVLNPVAASTPALPAPAPEPVAGAPRLGVLELSQTSTSAIESTGWLRWLFEQRWQLPYRLLTPADVAAGGLQDLDVLVVPDGPVSSGLAALGGSGQAALQAWVGGGGRYVGFRGGTEIAVRLGLSTATLAAPTSDVPGSLFRVLVDQGSPLGSGVGGTAYSFYAYDRVLHASDPAYAPVRFPATGSGDWFVSGFASGAEELAGTAAVVDEPSGAGRVVLFAADPNFRAFTDGTQRILRNALLGADPAATAAAATARRAVPAASVLGATDDLVLTVRPVAADRLAALLQRHGARATVLTAPGKVSYRVDLGGKSAEELPWVRALVGDVRALGDQVVAVRVP